MSAESSLSIAPSPGKPTPLPAMEVIAVVSNSRQYESRYELYKQFSDELDRQTVRCRLWTVELQHGVRPMQITNEYADNHIQLWTSGIPGEIWHKENLINYAINHISRAVPQWRYVAWIDADFKFEPDAFEKTIQALQLYDVVQMWSHLINLGPGGGVINNTVGISYMWGLLNGELASRKNGDKYPGWLGSPGGAWAARRESLNKIGSSLGSPFIDWTILGSGDLYLAASLNGMVGDYFGLEGKRLRSYSSGYRNSMLNFQNNAVHQLKKNIGVVENTIRHMFHGRAKDRQYNSRSDILIKYQFDPFTDLKKDVSGINQLVVNSERQIGLRDACRRYFATRNEDANTL